MTIHPLEIVKSIDNLQPTCVNIYCNLSDFILRLKKHKNNGIFNLKRGFSN